MTMIKILVALTVIAMLSWLYSAYKTYTDANAPVIPNLINEKINADAITRGLPLAFREDGKSDNGRIRLRWKIANNETEHFEVIGNNQEDADKVGWICADYDSSGNHLAPTDPNHRCHLFLSNVLKHFVNNPEAFSTHLVKNHNAVQSGDLIFEVSNQFYSVRRQSRMHLD